MSIKCDNTCEYVPGTELQNITQLDKCTVTQMDSLGNMPEWTLVAKVCELPAIMHFIHRKLVDYYSQPIYS